MTGWTEITLDGCCGAGGGARGLVRAGHYVVGVDTNPELRDSYLRSGAHEFICADILDVLEDTAFLARFTFGSFHPPCQGYSGMSHCRPEIAGKYPRLIMPILARLACWWGERPWVIENVEGARGELPGPATYCMWMFRRQTYRHRLIAASPGLHRYLRPPEPPGWAWLPPENCIPARKITRNRICRWPHPVPTARAGHWEPGRFVSVAGHERKGPVRAAMEIDEAWMPDREDVAEAIPWYLGFEIAGRLAAWREEQEPIAV